LSQALGLDVVAEGVESETQEQVLSELGEHIIVQGYRYAKPMGRAQALAFLTEHQDKGLVGHHPKVLVHEPD
jgi:sensor c-di-GMP phosphodiesterase-like protein